MPAGDKSCIRDCIIKHYRNPSCHFVALIVIGVLIPLFLDIIHGEYIFFECADITMPLGAIVTAGLFYSNTENYRGSSVARNLLLIYGIFMFVLYLALITFKSGLNVSLYTIVWQGIFGFLMSLTVLLTIVLMSNRYITKKEETSRELGDTNLIFIFLAIVPVITTTSIYLTGGRALTFWGATMIPSTTGFLLGGLAILVGSIIKSTKDASVGIVAALLMFILGYLLFIASLPFVLESKTTSDYIALFEIISPLYLFSLIAVLPQGNSDSIISKIFGFNQKKDNAKGSGQHFQEKTAKGEGR